MKLVDLKIFFTGRNVNFKKFLVVKKSNSTGLVVSVVHYRVKNIDQKQGKILCFQTCQSIWFPDFYDPAKTVQNSKSVQNIWFPDKILQKLPKNCPGYCHTSYWPDQIDNLSKGRIKSIRPHNWAIRSESTLSSIIETKLAQHSNHLLIPTQLLLAWRCCQT